MAEFITCRSCTHLTNVDRRVAPDRGWCEVFECWQKCAGKTCRHFEKKEFTPAADRPKDDRRYDRRR